MNQLSKMNYSVAIVDDDNVYRLFVVSLLSKYSEISIYEATCEKDIVEILNNNPIDCILLDYSLGIDNGFSVKERLELRFSSVPPIVMLTGDSRERTVIRALRLGIDDYVLKQDLKAEELLSAIAHAVAKGRKEQLAQAEYQRLIQAAGLDPVTRLPGRNQLDERLAHLAALPPRGRAAYAIMLVQMDGLDDINASFGLKVGDQALRAFGDRLQRLTRGNDVCGRLKGRTFLVIVDARATSDVLDGICRRFADYLSFRLDLDAGGVALSAQIGGVLCSQVAPDGILTADTLMEAARETLAEGRAKGVPFHVPGASSPIVSGADSGRPPIAGSVASVPDEPARPAADQLRTSNRREKPRHRVLKRGQIILGANSGVDCTVRNLSESGAGLRIDSFFPIPHEFDLMIGGADTKRRVRVQWQIGNDLGVVYIG